jgi:chromosome partitioning protein
MKTGQTEDRLGIIIGVGNQKGGAGKTTNTVHVACALAELGRRVLIIDLDMNNCATMHFGVRPEAFLGSYELLLGEDPLELILSREDEEEGVSLPKDVHLLPASRKLEGIEDALRSVSKFVTPRKALERPLEQLRSHYDYILLDTAPNATTPTLAAYMVADYFLLSATPDRFAIEGLGNAMRDITDAKENGNENLILLGVLLTSFDQRTRLAHTLARYVEAELKVEGRERSAKFSTVISRSTVIPETQAKGKTLFATHPKHRVANQYRAVVRELEERLMELADPSDERVMKLAKYAKPEPIEADLQDETDEDTLPEVING